MYPKLLFTLEDAKRAHDEWGANCGPAALAAILGVTLEDARKHLLGFEEKRYTNPTMMWCALNLMKTSWRMTTRSQHCELPKYGLARIQWEGPWTMPGVPARVAYRHTHWVGVNSFTENIAVFDVNAMASGGWVSLTTWSGIIVPWILKECEPKANGRWHITHSVEIK